MQKVENIIQLEKQIRKLETEIYTAYKSFKFALYTQNKIDFIEDTSCPGDFKHTSDVVASNSDSDYSYTLLYSDSLISVILHCSLNWCEVYSINSIDSDHWPQIASFVRKNEKALRAHHELEKLENMLATGSLDNLQIVMQLLKHT